MTVQLKVKGYINGNKWGAFEPTIALKTYEELIAMTRSDALTELNEHPLEYFNLLSEDDGSGNYHLPSYNASGWGNILGNSSSAKVSRMSQVFYAYNISGYRSFDDYDDKGRSIQGIQYNNNQFVEFNKTA